MNQPPSFQFYPDNFVQGTADMTPSEVGAYIRLLCHQWSNGAIPNEKARLSIVAGGDVSDHVLMKFPKGSDGLQRNGRMEKERQKQLVFRAKQSEVGKLGGRPKKGSLTQPFSPEKGLANPSQSPPSPTPVLRESYAERPSLQEVLFHGDKIGLAAWKAEDWFHEMEGGGWLDHNHRPVDKWQSILTRVKVKWEADGRPKGPPSNANNGKPRQQGVDRNQGTANAGCIGQYDGMGKVLPVQP